MRLLQNSLALVAGMTAMVAQLVWVRYETQLLGLSSWTISSVIGMALLGLALGNRWAGRQPRFGLSLKFASLMLCGTGLAVFLMPAMFWLASSFDVALFHSTPTGGNGWIGKLWILVVAAPAMLVHFCAGAVFPALLHGRDATASTAGRIAAVETLGACVGATLAGCLLMEVWGMQLTLLLSGAFAMLVAACGLAFSKSTDEDEDVQPLQNVGAASVQVGAFVWPAVFLAGMASLGLEVIWQRLLILLVGTDGYSLTIVVVAYLIGIALGAAWAARWINVDSSADGNTWRARVAGFQLIGALVSVVVLAVFVYLATGPGQAWLNAPLGSLEMPLMKRAILCCGLLVFPAAVNGASWPLLLRAIVSQRTDAVAEKLKIASLAANVYALVAIGNAVGVIVTGFLLVPGLGLQNSLLVLIAIAALSAWMIAGPFVNRTTVALTAAVVSISLVKLFSFQPVGIVIESDSELLYYREGPAHTVAVLADPVQASHRRLIVDGIIVGQTGDNVEEKQLLLAHLAPLLRAGQAAQGQGGVKRAVVIGLGSGILSGELAGIAGVESVTSIELSPSVIEAAEQFSDLSPTATAKTKTVQADGIWWLKKQRQQFDAIISDGKSRPGHVGNSAFFSADYYRCAAQRLTDEGLFVQWVSLDANVRETRIVVKTFSESFPHAYVGIATPNSLYLVGSKAPIKCDSARIDQYLDSDDTQSLRDYFWQTTDDIRAMAWIKMKSSSGIDVSTDHAVVSPSGRKVPVLLPVERNSLDRPLLERVSFDVREEKLKANRVENLDLFHSLLEQTDCPVGLFDSSLQRQGELKEAIGRLLLMAHHEVQQEQGWANKAIELYREALDVLPELSRGQYLAKISFAAAVQAAQLDQPEREASLLIQGVSISGNDFVTQMRVAKRLDELLRFEDSVKIYSGVVQIAPHDVLANRGLANALVKIGKLKQAVRYFRAAGDDDRAQEIEQQGTASVSTWESGIPKISEPQTDEQRARRLLDLLSD